MTNQLPLDLTQPPPPPPTQCYCESKTPAYKDGKQLLEMCDVIGGCRSYWLNGEKLPHAQICKDCKKLGLSGFWLWFDDGIMPRLHLGIKALGCQYVPF